MGQDGAAIAWGMGRAMDIGSWGSATSRTAARKIGGAYPFKNCLLILTQRCYILLVTLPETLPVLLPTLLSLIDNTQ